MSYKTSIQLEDWQNIAINEIAREDNISTEQIILDAINAFLQKKLELKQDVKLTQFAGIIKREIDGLDFQHELRNTWDSSFVEYLKKMDSKITNQISILRMIDKNDDYLSEDI